VHRSALAPPKRRIATSPGAPAIRSDVRSHIETLAACEPEASRLIRFRTSSPVVRSAAGGNPGVWAAGTWKKPTALAGRSGRRSPARRRDGRPQRPGRAGQRFDAGTCDIRADALGLVGQVTTIFRELVHERLGLFYARRSSIRSPIASPRWRRAGLGSF
jgi:hypothetical protein